MAEITKNYGNGWIQKFPTEEGEYWFYGQRFGGSKKMEMLFCQVYKAGDTSMFIEAQGNFMYKNDLGDKWAFKKTEFPEPPIFEDEKK